MHRNTSITVLNAVAAAWFVLAAFLWHRGTGERLNALVIAVLAALVAFAAARVRALRWLDVPLGLWIVASIWLVPHQDRFTSWNLFAWGAALLIAPPTVRWLDDRRPVGAAA